MLKAAEIIREQRLFLKADSDRMSRRPKGTPRFAWRRENPIRDVFEVEATDTKYKSRPTRLLTFDTNGSATDLWVWSIGKAITVIERIDLIADDADSRLARYEPCVGGGLAVGEFFITQKMPSTMRENRVWQGRATVQNAKEEFEFFKKLNSSTRLFQRRVDASGRKIDFELGVSVDSD